MPTGHAVSISQQCLKWFFAAGLVSTVCILNAASVSAQTKKTSPAVDFNRLKASAAAATVRVAAGPAGASTFQLHSRPTATKVIYLDFDGHVTTNTWWNGSDPTITTTAYDTDGSPSTFSSSEQANIVEIWQRIAECYSPFDVDVTTEDPTVANLINTGAGDTRWGMRVLFGDSNPSPAPNAGGVAFLTSFGLDIGAGVDTPCFVLAAGVGTSPKPNADAAVHEVGHTLGLTHDGLFPANDPNHVEYYSGQGTGKVAWAPHMGVGYYVPLVQWSKGEYANASNTQDDLQIITSQNGFGYRQDDYASSQGAAKTIPGTPGSTSYAINVSGVIETNTDSDWFKIIAGSGPITLNAVGGPANTMLDIQLSLYNSSGNLVVASNPTTDVIASISQSVTGGTFYVKIEGVGNGNPLTTGYTKYSSLGQYTITGSFSTKGIKGAPVLSGPGDLFYGVKSQPAAVNPNIIVTDSDNTTLPSATVKITNVVPAEDTLSIALNAQTMGNITATYDKPTGLLTLTSSDVSATVAQFQTALRAVSYSNSSTNPTSTSRKVDFQVSDGIVSSNILTSTVTIGYTYVTANYVPGTKTLTIVDDSKDNSIVITLRGSQVSLEGAGGTRIGNSSSSQQLVNFPYSSDMIIVCNFTAGNDSISLVSMKSSKTTLNLGDGNDSVTLTYCNIGNLIVSGGNGTDTLTQVGSVVTTKTLTSVP